MRNDPLRYLNFRSINVFDIDGNKMVEAFDNFNTYITYRQDNPPKTVNDVFQLIYAKGYGDGINTIIDFAKKNKKNKYTQIQSLSTGDNLMLPI